MAKLEDIVDRFNILRNSKLHNKDQVFLEIDNIVSDLFYLLFSSRKTKNLSFDILPIFDILDEILNYNVNQGEILDNYNIIMICLGEFIENIMYIN